MATFDDFSFSKDEVRLIFSLQHYSLRGEAEREQDTSLWQNLTKNNNDLALIRNEIREKKIAWLKHWREVTQTLLGADVLEEPKLSDQLSAFARKNSKEKGLSMLMEIATFTPYFEIPTEDGETGPHCKGIEFDESIYINRISTLLRKIGHIPSAELDTMRSSYKKAIGIFEKSTSKGMTSLMLWVGLAALTALIVAPYLAGAIGAAMGLSGAAATSAGLALLGGGSIAAGGFGMAGGYFAVMAGGMLLGYIGASTEDKLKIREISSNELLVACAKMHGLLLAKKKSRLVNDTDLLVERKILVRAVRHIEYDIGKTLDLMLISTEKESKEDIKEMRKKSSILRAFREELRTL